MNKIQIYIFTWMLCLISIIVSSGFNKFLPVIIIIFFVFGLFITKVGDWRMKTKQHMIKCVFCGKNLVEVKDETTGKKTGHIFKCTCKDWEKNIKVSVG